MSTENAYRAVRVKVMNEFSDAHISRVLPPEHRVTATAPLSGHNSRELLIEGPMLPPGSEPPTADMIFCMSGTPDERIEITARFVWPWPAYGTPDAGHSPSWVVGTWDTMAAYQAEMDSLA